MTEFDERGGKGDEAVMEPLNVLLIGAGGYGANYVRELLMRGDQLSMRLAGVVDPNVVSSPCYPDLCERRIPLFQTVDQFYDQSGADLAVIATPIQFHARQTIACLAHGSHVLCEKPAAATPEDVERMIAARNEYGKALAIGFQWCYDPAMLRLKADADAGLFGRPIALKSIVLAPRPISYFRRSTLWGGRKYDRDGAPVFDSVASNATSHYLQNLLWIAGPGWHGATIRHMNVRTLRANEIETFDTIMMDAVLENGAKLLFVASHAVGETETQPPAFVYEFEKAMVQYGGIGKSGDKITAVFNDGSVMDYGFTSTDGVTTRLERIAAIARGEPLDLPCPAEAALSHTRAMAMIRETQPEADVFAPAQVRTDHGFTWVPGLKNSLVRCYEDWVIPSVL